MNPPPDTASPFPIDSHGTAAPMRETQPMVWSIRRELWENRSIYMAPLIVAAVVLFSTMVGTMSLPKKVRNLSTLEPAKQVAVLARPFRMAPAPIMLATILVGMFYSLDALYGERRDRSNLFWKSLPVSDRTTVLAKACVPLAVLPLIAYVLSVITQVFLLFFSTSILLGAGLSPTRLWAEVRFFQGLVIMAYGLLVHALWFAPIYGWLLLVSAWARRATLLWAVLPLLAASAVEKILSGTSRFGSMLRYRLTGAMEEAFVSNPSQGAGDITWLAELTPGRFLSAPGLWVGLALTVAFLAAAIRLRRNREPI